MAIDQQTIASPLLVGEGIAKFDTITPEIVDRDIPYLLQSLGEELGRLEDVLERRLKSVRQSQASGLPVLHWEDVMTPLHRIEQKLDWSWGVIEHLLRVNNSQALRDAHQRQEPAVIEFSNRLAQSRTLYRSFRQLLAQHRELQGPSQDGYLESEQRRILRLNIQDMELQGVGLEGDVKQEFNAASARLAELSSQFSSNLLDATKSWTLRLTDVSDVSSLPQRLRELLAESARNASIEAEDSTATAEKGPWLLGLDSARANAFLEYSDRRDLRETVYRALRTRASEGEINNTPIVDEILRLRQAQAERLGYQNWAEVSLASKMAGSVDTVEDFLETLRRASFPFAKQELNALARLAADRGAVEASDLQPWDFAYWAENLRREAYDLDQEMLRSWFPLDQVLDGLFGVAKRLFNIEIIEAPVGEMPVWHPDVSFYKVYDARTDKQIAGFFLDPYSRPGSKRGGAWMDVAQDRGFTEAGDKVLPIAYLVCNQSPPTQGAPSLMSFGEVKTLFHEFGHALQLMLTTETYPQVTGLNNVEWDAVELASQFMENWSYDRKTMFGMAQHWQTGEGLPESEYKKLLDARRFRAGTSSLFQVHLGLTDLLLHSSWRGDSGVTPEQFRREIAKKTTVVDPIQEDAFLNGFSHIFDGGYAAGYYSYKWAEVLSADAFQAFVEVGLRNSKVVRELGMRFRETILSQGGSRPAAKIYRSFRGRDARVEGLIEQSGLDGQARRLSLLRDESQGDGNSKLRNGLRRDDLRLGLAAFQEQISVRAVGSRQFDPGRDVLKYGEVDVVIGDESREVFRIDRGSAERLVRHGDSDYLLISGFDLEKDRLVIAGSPVDLLRSDGFVGGHFDVLYARDLVVKVVPSA